MCNRMKWGSDMDEAQQDRELREKCLLWAFETREVTNTPTLVVTNVAEDYYQWVKNGQCQAKAIFHRHKRLGA